MKSKTYICLAVCFLVLSLISVKAQPQEEQNSWTAEKEMLMYYQAAREISMNSVWRPSMSDIAAGSIRAYLEKLDPYSDYLPPDEYAVFKDAQKSGYSGVGMEIEKTETGRIVCMPYPNGPAAKAGIAAGDILVSVDGKDISGESILKAGMRIRGDEGTNVVLTVKRGKNAPQKKTVTRAPIDSKSVSKKWIRKIPVIQIMRFALGTQRELAYALEKLNRKKPIVIDLRQNPGGDLNSAIDCAMLFLEKGKHVIDVVKPNETKAYESFGEPVNTTSPLWLWQDENTASAAEVFIAALTGNERAQSVGKKTYGKGTMQSIVELGDGSALFLTTAYLQTNTGERYNGKGLPPTHPLESDSPKTKDYLAEIRKSAGHPAAAAKTVPAEPKKEKKEEPTETVEKEEKTEPEEAEEKPDDEPTAEPDPKAGAILVVPNVHFTCFDKDFATEQEAEIWSMVIKNSFDDVDNQYLLQRQKPDGIKFMVCLGPYATQKIAEKKKNEFSGAIETDVFVKSVKQAEFVVGPGFADIPEAKEKEPANAPQTPKGKNPKPGNS